MKSSSKCVLNKESCSLGGCFCKCTCNLNAFCHILFQLNCHKISCSLRLSQDCNKKNFFLHGIKHQNFFAPLMFIGILRNSVFHFNRCQFHQFSIPMPTSRSTPLFPEVRAASSPSSHCHWPWHGGDPEVCRSVANRTRTPPPDLALSAQRGGRWEQSWRPATTCLCCRGR